MVRLHRLLRSALLAVVMAEAPAMHVDAPTVPSLEYELVQACRPFSWSTYRDCLDEVRRWGREPPSWVVRSCPLDYIARKPCFDPAGHPVTDDQGHQATVPVALTGRVFYPPAWRRRPGSSLSLVVYLHSTELGKAAVASRLGGDEWMLGAAAAAWFGYAVAMPDLPGMGGDAGEYHPFCHADSLAHATVDCIPEALRALRGDGGADGHRYAWNGRLFLAGYSEGGYAALAAVRELEARGDARLTGSACLAGPFDLSGAMRELFIDPVFGYSRPYYMPYFVLGYHAVYGPRMDPLQVFAPVLLDPVADGDILAWADGSMDGLVVDAALGRRLALPGDAIPLPRLFNPAWLDRELQDPAYPTSDVHRMLAENDVCGGWRPTRPILFRHSPDDCNIPYANTLWTVDQLGQAVRAAGGDPGALLHLLPIGRPGDGISHTAGAYLSLPSAFAWFYYGMPDLDIFAGLKW